MNVSEFLDRSVERLSRLLGDHGYESERSQVRAKALLRELAAGESVQVPRFTFREDRLWRNCQFILEAVVRKVMYGEGESEVMQRAAHLAAETAEYLARVADEVDRGWATVTASLLYHLAGYEANGICLARTASAPGPDQGPNQLFAQNTALFLLRRLRELRTEA